MFSFAAFRSQLTKILHLQESPHRTALAFSIGVFIAFAPHYGFHTLSVVFLAWLFRLNYLVVFLGALVNNPWTIIPILGVTFYTGFAVFGMPQSALANWQDLELEDIYGLISEYLLPFIVGGCLLGVLGALLAYPIMLYTLQRYRAIKAQ